MRSGTLSLFALLWPMAAVLVALLSPGPGEVPANPQLEQRRLRIATPPTDDHGSTVFLGSDKASGSARVFWEEPGKVQFKMVVEIPPGAKKDDAADASAKVEEDSASAVDESASGSAD
jgi:hypothetical protein